jgi:hypothetical protein
MSDKDKKGDNTVTVDLKLEELLNIVARVGSSPLGISDSSSEAVEVGKAWHEAVFKNIEKLSEAIETVRRVDLESVRVDLKERIEKLEARMDKEEAALNEYKKEIVRPMEKNLYDLVAENKVEAKKSAKSWAVWVAIGSSIVIKFLEFIFDYIKGGTP